MTVGIYLHM